MIFFGLSLLMNRNEDIVPTDWQRGCIVTRGWSSEIRERCNKL